MPHPRKFTRWARIATGSLLITSLFLASGAWAQQNDGRAIEQAVVLIEVTGQRGDWFTPWQRTNIERSSGSGFLIARGQVMTNAHVVSDARQILVRRNGRSTPSFAKVLFIAHDADLAVLQVDDPEFDEGVEPLVFGTLPNLRTRVRTYGFPAGGEKISRTEGVVSRVEFITYLHSGADSHLGIQTDSAINPGNSGGPVLQNGKVVGVAFQTNTRLNDVGFFIPTPVIKRFLTDIADGHYDGYAELGLMTSNLINSSYRKYLGFPAGMTGVVVDRVLWGTTSVGQVKPGDVLTAVNGTPIANDGTIDFHGHSLGHSQIVEGKQIGEIVEVSLWRDRAPLVLKYALGDFPDAARLRLRFDESPHYIIYAGLVFMQLDQQFLNTFGNYWENADKNLLYTHFFRPSEMENFDGKPAIVLTRILPHEINSAYRRYANEIVNTINGMKIDSLNAIPKALKAGKGEFHRIELENRRSIVLRRREADAAHPVILKTYGIRQDRRLK